MINITYLPKWEEWEAWYPVLYFEIFQIDDLHNFKRLLEELAKSDNFQFKIIKWNSDYSLVNLNSLCFSSTIWWNILLKKSLFWNFTISLDKKYWEEAFFLFDPLIKWWNWYIYLDEFWDIKDLHEDATIIIAKKLEI